MCVACAAWLPAAAPGAPFPDAGDDLTWPDGRSAGGRLRWTGCAGLRLDLAGVGIAFDPFVTRPGLWRTLLRRPVPDASRVAKRYGHLAGVFVGHTHYDHAMDLPAVATASPDAQIYGSSVTLELCRRLGIDEERLVRVEDGSRHRVGPFEVEAIASAHGKVPFVRLVDRREMPRRGLPRTPFRYPRGEVFAWRVVAGERTLHVQGSAGLDEGALARQRPVDVLFACLAARRGTPGYLARLGERLTPQVVAPLHHDDFFRAIEEPPRPVAGLRWDEFLADVGDLAARHGTRLWCPPFDREIGW